jgi:hypothetical protein
VKPFNDILTYRLTYPECCGLANPDLAADLLAPACCVDSLAHYTTEMWDILNDVILQEWFGLRLPPSKVPWQGPVYLPDRWRLRYCLDRSYARQAKGDIDRHYLSLNRMAPSMSIFASYLLVIPNDLERERDGLSFLARQAEHFRSLDDYLFIIQEI